FQRLDVAAQGVALLGLKEARLLDLAQQALLLQSQLYADYFLHGATVLAVDLAGYRVEHLIGFDFIAFRYELLDDGTGQRGVHADHASRGDKLPDESGVLGVAPPY